MQLKISSPISSEISTNHFPYVLENLLFNVDTWPQRRPFAALLAILTSIQISGNAGVPLQWSVGSVGSQTLNWSPGAHPDVWSYVNLGQRLCKTGLFHVISCSPYSYYSCMANQHTFRAWTWWPHTPWPCPKYQVRINIPSQLDRNMFWAPMKQC